MSMSEYSLSDLATATGGGSAFGGNGGMWLLIILFFLVGFGGNGFGNRYGSGEFGTFATASSQNEILLGQKFDALGQKINQIGDGICSSTYALNNAITTEGRTTQSNIDALRFDMANYNASTAAAIHSEGEATRAMLQQNKIESLQAQVNQLSMQQQLCGVVRYPNAMTYSAGTSPFCNCGCNSF